MIRIPLGIKEELKKPLGELHRDFTAIKKLSKTHRIIAVGDVCTLGLLAMGIRPHLAVFDYRFMRHALDDGMISILRLNFRKPVQYTNPPGMLSGKLLADAPKLIRHGGGVLIKGEEDLTALAFIKNGSKREIVVYGQPHEGLVVVRPDEKIKKKIEGWLSAALALGHKIKRHESE